MKKLILTAVSLAGCLWAGPNLCDYNNAEFNNISFDDSLMIISRSWSREAAPGSQGPTGEGGKDSTEFTPFVFEYDSASNSIEFFGKGRDYIFTLDEQKRVTYMRLGYINYTSVSYPNNEMIIQNFPNDSNLTEHSREWRYIYHDDGKIDMLVITPSDWDYNGPKFWGRDNADTIDYSYDSEGRISGIKKVLWTTNLYHSEPWKRTEDSLQYSYGDVDGKNARTITQYSPAGSEWIVMKGDTQWVSFYNENGEIYEETKRRWDGSNVEWEQLYYTNATLTYENGRLATRREVQYFGTADEVDSFVIWDEKITYGPNTLIYGATPVKQRISADKGTHLFRFVNSSTVELTGTTERINRIDIYTLAGRRLRTIEGTTRISVEGLSKNQPLLFMGFSGNSPVAVSKMILK